MSDPCAILIEIARLRALVERAQPVMQEQRDILKEIEIGEADWPQPEELAAVEHWLAEAREVLGK